MFKMQNEDIASLKIKLFITTTLNINNIILNINN